VRYWVRVGDRALEVDLRSEVPLVDGEPLAADLVPTGNPGLYHLRLPGDAVTLVARRGPERGNWRILLDGVWLDVEVIDERTRTLQALSGAPPAPADRSVRAPMPGLVLEVHVAPGDAVQAGQPVAVVEAMKMENELRAPAAGRVVAVHVAPGQTVERGAVLLDLE
jgi:acetyl/propionyl-CoA carboxylase alpha subunit